MASSSSTWNFNGIKPPIFVPYMDLGDGLNTKDDDHSLLRSQLAVSINTWYAYGRAISKRPGSAAYVSTTGATGTSVAGKGIVTARFNNVTYTIVQQGSTLKAAAPTDTSWTTIGTVSASAGPIQAAQMFEPYTQMDTLWIVNGVDQPLAWQGPGHSVVTAASLSGSASLPTKYSSATIITPAYVTAHRNFLLYANDPSQPSAVYVSDPLYPLSFTVPASTTSIGTNSYQPYLIGNNDGVEGGNITGIAPLNDAIIIYKEAAIYSFTLQGFYGDLIFFPALLSTSVGLLSPQSLERFDTFHCILGIDGVYQVNLGGTQQISSDVPTYFDSTLSGTSAVIYNRLTAVGVRAGQRYLIWFQGSGANVNSRGLWFDFAKTTKTGLPSVGEIAGMNVAGARALRGPGDDGNFVWVDSMVDRVGKFGLTFADFGNAIMTTFYGKADFMEDVFHTDGPLRPKTFIKAYLILSLGDHLSSQNLNASFTFSAYIVNEWFRESGNTGGFTISSSSGGWGSLWGNFNWSASQNGIQTYAVLELDQAEVAKGLVGQFGVSESSTQGWTIIGYILELAIEESINGTFQSL